MSDGFFGYHERWQLYRQIPEHPANAVPVKNWHLASDFDIVPEDE